MTTNEMSPKYSAVESLMRDLEAARAEVARLRREWLKVGDELNQCLQIIVTNAGNIKISTDGNEKLAAKRIEKAVLRAAKVIRGAALAPEQPGTKGGRE